MPKFEMPKFDNPKVEMPAAFREFAELGVAQAKDAYEKIRAPAEKATGVLEVTYGPAAKDASETRYVDRLGRNPAHCRMASTHDEASVVHFLDRPGRREAARI
jgi:hypothetical protein